MPYSAPLSRITHTLSHIARLEDAVASGLFPDFETDLVEPILQEANRLARDVLAPLNPIGHKQGAYLSGTGVIASPGLKDAYRQFVAGGWMGLAFPRAYGGQDLPKPLALAVFEMIHGANMSFGLCPLLSFGAIEALLAHGTDEQRQTYLPRLISGEWTGAMNLTEPQAGSDVGALVTKAEPRSDGSYAITGQKIYITWGDHDMTENIIQLVLARLPDAPAGSKGISLFVVPKFLINPDGSLGERNSFRCIGLERKMGIHASPTCVMQYDGATGWLVGEENKGLAAMFTMMNSARLNVGLEGVAIAEAALQAGLAYARERRQGFVPGGQGPVAIIRHPDVQRMLMTMASNVQAARSICYACGAAADIAARHPDEATQKAAKAREDLLTPLAKAWSTDRAVDVTHLGVQIHGGMGFMSDTAAAQYYLDARITPIYEGTNGIQAIDLAGRKLSLDDGAAMQTLITEIRDHARDISRLNLPGFQRLGQCLGEAADALDAASVHMLSEMRINRDRALAGASTYLRLAGDVVGGYFLSRSAYAARDTVDSERTFALASFFAGDTLAKAHATARSLREGADAVHAASEDFWRGD